MLIDQPLLVRDGCRIPVEPVHWSRETERLDSREREHSSPAVPKDYLSPRGLWEIHPHFHPPPSSSLVFLLVSFWPCAALCEWMSVGCERHHPKWKAVGSLVLCLDCKAFILTGVWLNSSAATPPHLHYYSVSFATCFYFPTHKQATRSCGTHTISHQLHTSKCDKWVQ